MKRHEHPNEQKELALACTGLQKSKMGAGVCGGRGKCIYDAAAQGVLRDNLQTVDNAKSRYAYEVALRRVHPLTVQPCRVGPKAGEKGLKRLPKVINSGA